MSQYLKERLIGGNRRHRLFSCVAFLGRRHLGLGGVLMSVTIVTVRSFHMVRVIIDQSSGVDFRSGWWHMLDLPHLYSLFLHACGAWLACQGYLAISPSFPRPLIIIFSTDAFARRECSLLLPPVKEGRGIIQLRYAPRS